VVDRSDRAAQLYARFGPAVYRRCHRLLGDAEAAKDATQEVFVKLVGTLEALESRADLLPWVFRVATNHCLNARRDGARHGTTDVEPFLEVVPAPAVPFAERQLARAVLERFDVETRAIAIGVLVDGMEREEVALTLGISRRTVARKLERFLANARKYLARSVS
jgi:RNA polymerase sigma-70 factor, ECF subfamily